MVDRVLNELRQRFQAIKNINILFGFLNGAGLAAMNGDELKSQAYELAAVYKEDLDEEELAIEVQSFKYSYHVLDLGTNTKTTTPSIPLT